MGLKSNPFDGAAKLAFDAGKASGVRGDVVKNPYANRGGKVATAWVEGWNAGDKERKAS